VSGLEVVVVRRRGSESGTEELLREMFVVQILKDAKEKDGPTSRFIINHLQGKSSS
jgi:hypothetical protein